METFLDCVEQIDFHYIFDNPDYMLPTILLYVGTDAVENAVIIAIENDFVNAMGRGQSKDAIGIG